MAGNGPTTNTAPRHTPNPVHRQNTSQIQSPENHTPHHQNHRKGGNIDMEGMFIYITGLAMGAATSTWFYKKKLKEVEA